MRTRIAVLASGGGSNLGALLAHHDRLGEQRRSDVVAVLSDRSEAGALARARERHIAAIMMRDPANADAIAAQLDVVGVGLIVLAGYLRLVPPPLVARYRGRMINVHPALLPSFGGAGMYGLRIHRAALDAGVRVSGVTVHFVDEQYDRGPIIAQWPVPVLSSDTPERLAARVLRAEHELLPRVVEAVAAGTITLGDDGRVHGSLIAGDDAIFELADATTST